MNGLTRAQADCLAAIRRLTVDGVPPGYDELATALGLSSKGDVARLLNQLRDRGAVTWLPHRARSLVILEDQVSEPVIRALSDDAIRRMIDIGYDELAERSSRGVAA